MGLGMNEINSNGQTNHGYASFSDRRAALQYAIDEVSIGTPDSLALAVKMLGTKQVEIPLLNSLLKLQEETNGSRRNGEFAHQAALLQEQIISLLNKMLKSS